MASGLQKLQQPFPMIALDHQHPVLACATGPQLPLAALQQRVEIRLAATEAHDERPGLPAAGGIPGGLPGRPVD